MHAKVRYTYGNPSLPIGQSNSEKEDARPKNRFPNSSQHISTLMDKDYKSESPAGCLEPQQLSSLISQPPSLP